MNISNSTSSYASQSSNSQSRPQGPRPGGKEQLSSALQSIGVDDSTAASVLEQIDAAISALNSESSSGSSSRNAIRSVVDEVLEANGIDSAEVGEAIQSAGASRAGGPSRSGGPSGAGRPNGPPPPRKEDESETSTIESALLSAGADEASTDELISQIIGTIQELTTDAGSNVSQDELRSVLTSLLEENGVDFAAFEQAIGSSLGDAGSFLDLLA
ncbi:hypothetical protein Poly51_20150 [Rubripirellula tenax]|uniref:Uncharacterized protein n=1 Tax=Rubripirellula tenax TaxID=2528015 RepID=A0A5C6FHX6_9BACT|nr:hypothetical protein [Rubripirellula tenax]TWU59229.1 hypothetical protein Poly51_20150 [Rubripirellula tenax]